MKTITGYKRANGEIGIRNHLLIIPTVVCSNQVCNRIMQMVPNTVAIPHQHGCSQIGDDGVRTFATLAGIGKNPNVGGVIVIGLGCEGVNPYKLADEIRSTGKPVEVMEIQDVGGSIKTIERGIEVAQKMRAQIDDQAAKVDMPLSELKIGVKCGGSDATSGLASNPALGVASDRLVAQGGTVVISETTEIIGAEQLLAARCESQETIDQLYYYIDRFEREIARMGADMRGGNPSPGNIAGGLTTIEEKSLGCISKCGTAPLQGAYEYAEPVPGKGLYFMDSPGNDIECVSGMSASGLHLVCFTTGRGTPTGNPVVPVIKITGNAPMYEKMKDNIDVNVSGLLEGSISMDQAGGLIWDEICEVAAGKLTKAEILGHHEFSINRIGPSL